MNLKNGFKMFQMFQIPPGAFVNCAVLSTAHPVPNVQSFMSYLVASQRWGHTSSPGQHHVRTGARPRRLRAQNPTGMIHWDWDKVVNIPDFWPDFFRYQRHQPRLFWSWLKGTLLVIWTINEMSNKGWRLHTPRWRSKLWGAWRQLFHIGKIVGKHGDSSAVRLSLSQVGMPTPFGENHSDGD